MNLSKHQETKLQARGIQTRYKKALPRMSEIEKVNIDPEKIE